ncbi:transcription factor E2F1 [Trichonephila clavata]|uniref:Transcription factor E2F1 n=1 Tax=Trichonephila clavata TaxID=2740835 RepID=A0A8X6J197_TRICU|nr:transcription factor E2F1 [Trichonephila clavata]
MSRIISVNKSNSYDTATFKTPNFKEIVPAPCLYDPKKDETPNPILMDEFGQTPDHFYLATKKPQNTPTFFQVKRKLDLKPIECMDDNAIDTIKNKPKKKVVPERVRGSKTVDKPRYDTSLGQLTKKFLKLLYSATDGIVNLNTACTLLSVPKRRLYDITNVLEGAGLIQKKSRNNIQYMGRGSSPNKIKYELEKEINLLEAKENRLDELIYYMKSQILDNEDAKYHYITSQDIFHLDDFSQKMLIGLKTSPSVEVVESTEKTLFVRSSTTELEAYLLFEDFPFTNILHPKAALKEQSLSYEIKIANCTLDGEGGKLDPTEREETACANAHTHEKPIDNVSKSTDVYSPMCSGAFWSQGDTLIKNAFITEEDDIAPIGKHFLLQTEDQDLDFSFLEASENYSFSLDDGEGLTDLFDCNFSCP